MTLCCKSELIDLEFLKSSCSPGHPLIWLGSLLEHHHHHQSANPFLVRREENKRKLISNSSTESPLSISFVSYLAPLNFSIWRECFVRIKNKNNFNCFLLYENTHIQKRVWKLYFFCNTDLQLRFLWILFTDEILYEILYSIDLLSVILCTTGSACCAVYRERDRMPHSACWGEPKWNTKFLIHLNNKLIVFERKTHSS